jgi:hypothetical protein
VGVAKKKISLPRDRAIDHTGLFLDTGLFFPTCSIKIKTAIHALTKREKDYDKILNSEFVLRAFLVL